MGYHPDIFMIYLQQNLKDQLILTILQIMQFNQFLQQNNTTGNLAPQKVVVLLTLPFAWLHFHVVLDYSDSCLFSQFNRPFGSLYKNSHYQTIFTSLLIKDSIV